MFNRIRRAMVPFLIALMGLALANVSQANWVILSDKNGYFARGIPDPAFAKIEELARAGSSLTTVAFTATGGWVVLSGRNGYDAKGIPDPAFRELQKLARQGVKLKSIAFTPTGGWVIFHSKNGYVAEGIPDEAFAKIGELAKQGSNLKSVAFTQDGGWAVFFDQNGYFARNIPDEAFQKMGQLAKRGATLKEISFAPAGGWVILFDKNGYFARGIPEPAFGRIGTLVKDGVELKAVSFVPRASARVSGDDPATRNDILKRMADHQVPGLGIAVIRDGKLAWARSYGVLKAGSDAPVTEQTRFQAASVSKPVAALAALRLVGERKLGIDQEVNQVLTSWKVPENDLTRRTPPTLRQILSHSAGFTVHGFAGYPVGTTMPTLRQVLEGEAPANSAPIRVNLLPGSQMRYSGGGYTVLQQVLTDVTRQPFPEAMRKVVLDPLRMTASTYEQPLPTGLASQAATGHIAGSPIPGGWHAYPEMAAAGLWTTPSDVARFVIALQRAHQGDPGSILTASQAREMLRRQQGDAGLGVFLVGSGSSTWFQHTGINAGFECEFIGSVEEGEGAVLMSNGAGGLALIGELLTSLRLEYGWPSP